MYNIYKYQEDVKLQQSTRKQDENYTKWLLRHQLIEMKVNAAEKIKHRTQQFINQQSNNPSVVEDDHYKTWRYIKQHRDVEDSNKFIGFKAFRHRPNYDVGKYYSERQRKQIAHLAEKSQSLVNSRVIPHEMRSRSLRSQGPLNPKHTFRDRKSDHEYFQPRMRYTNITDKERIMQNSITYADKLHQVYENFSLTKSKIGKAKVSPSKDSQQQVPLQMIQSTYSDVGKNERYYYDAMNEEEESVPKINQSKTGSSWFQKEKTSPRKSYFKNAKTLALHGDTLAKAVMVQTQYQRKKDLTNLNKNLTNESFLKRPIL